jgi:hypothetical protein
MTRTSQPSRIISGLCDGAGRRELALRPRRDVFDRPEEPRRYGEAPLVFRLVAERDWLDDRDRLVALPVRWLALPVRWRVAPLDAGLLTEELLGARVAMMPTVARSRPRHPDRDPRVAPRLTVGASRQSGNHDGQEAP